MNPIVRGSLVTLSITLLLFFGWRKYSDFLSRGQQPPESAKILNEIEKTGVPDFTLDDLNGKPIKLSDFRGQLVLLNFWASWCEPCIKEFPSMIKLVKEMNGDLKLLAISADYERKDIEPFLKAFNVNSPDILVMWDKDQEVAKRFGTFKLPESYIINGDGRLLRKISGVEDWASAEAVAFFQQLLVQSREQQKSPTAE